MSPLLLGARLMERSQVFPRVRVWKKTRASIIHCVHWMLTEDAARFEENVWGRSSYTEEIRGGKEEQRLIKIWSAGRVYILCVMWECSRAEMDSRVIYLHIHSTFWSRPLARRHCSIGRFPFFFFLWCRQDICYCFSAAIQTCLRDVAAQVYCDKNAWDVK